MSAEQLVETLGTTLVDLYDMGYDFDIVGGNIVVYGNTSHTDPKVYQVRVPGIALAGRYVDLSKEKNL